MNGLWKDFPQKVQKHMKEVGVCARECCVTPSFSDIS